MMEQSPSVSVIPASGMPVQWQVGGSGPSTPEDCIRKKLFDLGEESEDGELNQWTSSSEYFSQSSHDNSCAMSDGFSQTNLFDDSPSATVCVCGMCISVCVCVCVGVCVRVRVSE